MNIEDIQLVGVKLTNVCNLKCYMCGQNKTEQCYEISYDKLINVIKSIKEKNSKVIVFLWGGEPLLYYKIIPLLKFLRENKVKTIINTNGTELTKYADILVKYKVERLIISIDGIGDKHDEIRGAKGTYKKVIKGVKTINKLKGLRPIVSCNTVITSKNYFEVSEITSKLLEEGLQYIELQLPTFISDKLGKAYDKFMYDNFYLNPSSWHNFKGAYMDIDIDILIRELKKINDKVRIVPSLDFELIRKYFKYPNTKIVEKKCTLPHNQLRIEANGNVVICPDFPDYVIGNIMKDDLKTILDSDKLENFIRKFHELPICHRCVMNYES